MQHSMASLPSTVNCHDFVHATAVGCVDGSLSVLFYADGEGKLHENADCVWTRRFKRAVRRVRFHHDGQSVFAVSSNRALCQRHVETGRKMRCVQSAHDHPPYALCTIDRNLLATGDETGECRLWDWRGNRPCIAKTKDCVDYISDCCVDTTGKLLLLTSGDGTLSVVDVRKFKLLFQSDEMESELLSVCTAASGKRILCGSGSGNVHIFACNDFDQPVERLKKLHKETVESIRSTEENFVLTASLDGSVRMVHLYPTKKLGIIVAHQDGVEEIDLSHDESFLVSCGHDKMVKVSPLNVEQYGEQNVTPSALPQNPDVLLRSDFFRDL